MSVQGQWLGTYEGDWLGAVQSDPNQMYGSAGFSLSCTGTLTADVVAQSGGGIGHGGFKRKKRFIEEDGKILVFETADDAARYVAAKEAIKPAQKVKKAKVVPIIKPVEIVPWERVETLANAYPEFNYAAKVYQASLDEDYARLVAIYHKLLEIEDEEILLLAA